MTLTQSYDLESFNRYILEETSFVDDAVNSLQGLYGTEWSAYDVAMAVNSIEEDSDYRVLKESEGGNDLVELWEDVDVSGDKLDEFEKLGFIRRTSEYSPNVRSKLLAELYLDKVDEITQENI